MLQSSGKTKVPAIWTQIGLLHRATHSASSDRIRNSPIYTCDDPSGCAIKCNDAKLTGANVSNSMCPVSTFSSCHLLNGHFHCYLIVLHKLFSQFPQYLTTVISDGLRYILQTVKFKTHSATAGEGISSLLRNLDFTSKMIDIYKSYAQSSMMIFHNDMAGKSQIKGVKVTCRV